MSGSTDLDGVHGIINDVEFGASQAARSPRFQLNDWVLRLEMRWLHVLMATGIEREDRCE